ncbi:metal ABC transporter ATP-binding protein [Leucobacter sp. M11]|uniref:metal ABC transporter ATP-binding protein n=1 Tax=Leucobacter sp. M11 TaxID=2993565 RepID=UPI002D7E5447|nr:ABC transporter ATP-binding protein [Leucobacter sp. M11]MEB4614856.1 ABC transporter ATP-binding protein [Leucobacter sp. M11]
MSAVAGNAPDDATPVVELDDAAFGYAGTPSVHGVTARIHAGDSVALIGPNGSGKSTLLGGVLGLTEHLGGTLRVLGGTPRQALSRIGYLPQADRRDRELPITLRQAVTMGLYRELGPLRPVGRAGRARVTEAIEAVGLGQHAGAQFGELSGGQQQRGILARALVADPELVLLDEPFNGLDRPNRDSLLVTVNRLRAEGRTILVSTHDLELAREACSHVMLLNGEMLAFGTVAETLEPELVRATFHGAPAETGPHGDDGHHHGDAALSLGAV